MARMRDVIEAAQKKRAKLLAQFNRMPEGSTITELAEKHGVTRARMSQLIIKAKDEAVRAKLAKP
jgi:DNA-binding MarR family transcriptional regulator